MRATAFVMGTVAFTLLVGWLTWRTALWLRTASLDFNPVLPVSELVGRLVMIGVCIGLGKLSGLPTQVLGWTTTEPLVDIGWGLALGATGQVVLNVLTVGAVRHWGWHLYSPLLVQAILPRTRAEWVAVPLAMAPGVLLEELLFRSLWIGGFSDLADPWLMAGLVALAYGALHLLQGPLGAIVGTAIGFGLAALFLWRGSLLAPLAAHLVYNWLQLWAAHRQRDWLRSYDMAPGRRNGGPLS